MNNRLCLFAMVGVHLFCLASTPAFAWGDDGHEIVGMIADHYLEPAVRVQVQTILASDATRLTPDTGIASEATWADRYRDSDRKTTKVRYNQTYNWHFIDLELDGADVRTACFGQPALPPGTVATNGAAKDCIVDKITEFAAELHDPGIDADERRMALQFLLHFVGDLHQPLHASDNHDHGGNGETVSGSGIPSFDLHHDWDTEFVNRLGPDDGAIAQQLIGAITDAQAAAWSSGAPVDWAQESYALGRHKAYGLLPAPISPHNYHLTASYVSEAKTVVASQLSKAGVRLAFILNTALRVDGADAALHGDGPGFNPARSLSAPMDAATVSRDLLWFRTSAEMQAAYLQAYAVASDRLPSLAAGRATGTWAVIMDADETILNNSEWTLRGIIPDPNHPKGSWTDWVREVRSTALPGAKSFVDRVHALGGKVIVVTNRDNIVCDPTRQNLANLGIAVEGVLCATDASTNKNPRFQSVIDGTSPINLPPLHVVAFLGDNIQDFPGKLQAAPGSFDEFGHSLFIFPNPVYGSWERNVLH